MKSDSMRRKKSGLTLVEVLASVTVAAAILAALSAPMAVGIINRRQGQDVTQATNLAQLEIEAIRRSWQIPAPVAPAVAGQASTTTLGQQNYDKNIVSVAWNPGGAGCVSTAVPTPVPVAATPTSDSTDAVTGIKVLNNQANIPPNSSAITAALSNIPIDADNDCNRDYWGQVMVSDIASSSPTGSGAATVGMKRIVVRIFRSQSNLAALDYVPVNARTSLYNASGIQKDKLTTAAGAAVSVSFLDLPVVVLVADIARS
jgi:type II secretory pathway pseudopilin PulG